MKVDSRIEQPVQTDSLARARTSHSQARTRTPFSTNRDTTPRSQPSLLCQQRGGSAVATLHFVGPLVSDLQELCEGHAPTEFVDDNKLLASVSIPLVPHLAVAGGWVPAVHGAVRLADASRPEVPHAERHLSAQVVHVHVLLDHGDRPAVLVYRHRVRH